MNIKTIYTDFAKADTVQVIRDKICEAVARYVEGRIEQETKELVDCDMAMETRLDRLETFSAGTRQTNDLLSRLRQTEDRVVKNSMLSRAEFTRLRNERDVASAHAQDLEARLSKLEEKPKTLHCRRFERHAEFVEDERTGPKNRRYHLHNSVGLHRRSNSVLMKTYKGRRISDYG